MAYERGYLAVRSTQGDTLIDSSRKVCDTILKVVMRNLHDVYGWTALSTFG